MKNIVTYLFIFFSFLAFVSCDEDTFKTKIDPPEVGSKPQCVVQGYLSPNSEQVGISLSWSIPIFSSYEDTFVQDRLIKEARVILTNSYGKSVQLFLDRKRRIYFTDKNNFPIKENENYKLEVEIPNQPKITATCFVPAQFSSGIQNMRTIKTTENGSDAYQVAFEFDDIPNQKNYYLVDIKVKNSFFNKVIKVQPFTDNNRDGKKITVRSENILGNPLNAGEITVSLFSVDKSFYDYQRTILRQEEARNLGAFAEPVIIISNINNGLGIFGGYTKISKKELLTDK